ncbi:unnamed protein product [Caenorhabditis bovis]|uniref:Globin family profile domain-containing protein n=1 Tax=Caenorhabditis bovis TaxID=2654633 RepID=A0A8S1EBC3_9PELO|nr:unnamed protein product [Caenorhabditis bovis]
MMRIKEAIQRKKLIHEMNEEFREFDYDLSAHLTQPQPTRCPSPMVKGVMQTYTEEYEARECRLQSFVLYLSGRLTDLQKRALKITWKRLSEVPKTSGRGTLHIMEKVLTKLCEKSPGVTAIFYKSAFLSCIEDRKDHAHILITLIDDILHIMFEGPLEDAKYDPDSIGEAHCRLGPLGFDRSIWHVFGECFAEVMFNQECIRAYPHAPSAWSLLAVALTDRILSANKMSIPKSASRIDLSAQAPNASSRCPSLAAANFNFTPHKRSLPSVAQVSLDFSEMNYRKHDSEDEIFVTARTSFDPMSQSMSIPTTPHRKLPSTMRRSLYSESNWYDSSLFWKIEQ